MVSPSHRQQWQIPLRSRSLFADRIQTNVTFWFRQQVGVERFSQWLRSAVALANVVIRACTHWRRAVPHEAVELIENEGTGRIPSLLICLASHR